MKRLEKLDLLIECLKKQKADSKPNFSKLS